MQFLTTKALAAIRELDTLRNTQYYRTTNHEAKMALHYLSLLSKGKTHDQVNDALSIQLAAMQE